MKLLIILIAALLIIGPLYVLYELGLKYKKRKRIISEKKNNKKNDDIKTVSSYKIRFNDSKNNK
jgi:archaellum component FlaF (FlaF/FlaG flagellin family)